MSTATFARQSAQAKHDPAKNGVAEKSSSPDEIQALKRRILIVEDEDMDRQQLQRLLESDADLQIDGTGKVRPV